MKLNKLNSDDNISWRFDTIENIDIEYCSEENIRLNNLLDETRKVYINTKDNVIK